jgi:hypothetical protein
MNNKKIDFKNLFYWLVEGIGLAILLISLFNKIAIFFPTKEKQKDKEKETKKETKKENKPE